MKEIEKFNVLAKLGSITDEIHFRKNPDPSILNALIEDSDGIKIHLPKDKVFGFLDEFDAPYFGPNIITGNFETDIFIDSVGLLAYPNLSNLVLTCHNKEVETLDGWDLLEFHTAITNLTELKTLTFDLDGMKDQPIEEIEMMFVSNFKIPVEINKSGRKRKTHKRLPSIKHKRISI
jgi:hypothetical protein